MAQAITDLRAALTPEVMKPVMALMNTPLGFMTDRTDPHNLYTVDEVREFAIETTLRGFWLVGNEVNMIAKRMYAAQAGCAGKLNRMGKITDLVMDYELPHLVGDRGATIEYKASWKQNGTPQSIKCTFPIKVNNGMGADAIIGKAKRKMLARILEQTTGVAVPEGEVEPDISSMKPATVAPKFPAFTKPALAQPSKPEPKPAPEATPEQSGTIRNDMADFLASNRVDFTAFQRALVELKIMPEADSISEWNEVPIALCQRLQKDKKLLLSIIEEYQTKN